MSTTNILLLGLLTEGPAHGYELKKRVAARSGDTVRLENKVLYSALRDFEESGAVTSVVVPQEGSPPRRVFTLTPAGGEQLRDLLEDFGDELARDEGEFLVRFWFFDQVPAAVRARIIERRRAALRAHLGRVEGALARPQAERGSAYSEALVELARRRTQVDLAWIDEWHRREEGREP
jgi:DNA-binding PadR family transcriptional regulator